MRSLPPSSRLGLGIALCQWRLLLAVWVAPIIIGAPLMAVTVQVLRPVLAAPVGLEERWLLAAEALQAVWPTVVLLVGLTTLALWAWTVLWHAGAVSWQVWHGEARPRLARVLALGVSGWWPFARLSLTAGAALTIPTALVWLAVRMWFSATTGEEAVLACALVGCLATALIALFVRLATLHGAWRLALPTSRSAVAAWLAGARCVARTPVRSLATAVLWLALASVATAAASAAILASGSSGPVASIAEAAASAVWALCSVSLFASFAPTAGIGQDEKADE